MSISALPLGHESQPYDAFSTSCLSLKSTGSGSRRTTLARSESKALRKEARFERDAEMANELRILKMKDAQVSSIMTTVILMHYYYTLFANYACWIFRASMLVSVLQVFMETKGRNLGATSGLPTTGTTSGSRSRGGMGLPKRNWFAWNRSSVSKLSIAGSTSTTTTTAASSSSSRHSIFSFRRTRSAPSHSSRLTSATAAHSSMLSKMRRSNSHRSLLLQRSSSGRSSLWRRRQ